MAKLPVAGEQAVVSRSTEVCAHDAHGAHDELVREVSFLRGRVAVETEARERLEAELDLVNETNRMLRVEISRRMQECDYFRSASYRYAEGVRKVFPLVERLHNTATFKEDGRL